MERAYEGLLIDVGGVLTTDIFSSFDAYLERQGVTGVSFRDLYFHTPEVRALLHRLEVGEVHHTDVQGDLARLIGVAPDRAGDLFPGLYEQVGFVPRMTDAVEALRRAGVRTGMLSNSWWFPMYERPFYPRAFDVQVVSGRVGMRKPERAMFERGIAELGVAPERIVFVDDFEENLPPAAELGLAPLLHDPADPERTIAELERRFGVALPAAA